jgi:hypothetical protein
MRKPLFHLATCSVLLVCAWALGPIKDGFVSHGLELIPRSDDPTVNENIDATVSPAEQAAAVDAMMGWAKENMTGGDDPRKHIQPTEMVKEKPTAQHPTGVWHARANQIANGIDVRGTEMNGILEDRAGGPGMDIRPGCRSTINGSCGITGETSPGMHAIYYRDADQVDPNPKISQATAIKIVEAMMRDRVGAVNKERGKGGKEGGKEGGAKRSELPSNNLLVSGGKGKESTARLEIHPGGVAEDNSLGKRGKRQLSWHVSVEGASAIGPIQLEAWVDQAGNIVEAFNNAQEVAYNGTGQGRTLYQGCQGGSPYTCGQTYLRVAYWYDYAVWVLNDLSLRFGAFDMYGSTSATYQASVSGCCGPYFGNYSTSDRNSSNADTLWSSIQTNSFMYYVLGRNFVDGSGGPRVYAAVDGGSALASARNHYGVNYNNAFWDGQKINLGDGDGFTFGSFATLDIIAHEWTHGLTQYTGGLNYSGESGALNESYSDIFGSMAERYWLGETTPPCSTSSPSCLTQGIRADTDSFYQGVRFNTWKVGEAAYTPATVGDALRYFYHPSLGGQPNDYPSRYQGSGDYGGVHYNSGIMNFAFYLLAKGGCGTGGCVNGIGASAATQIFWRAKRYYNIASDNFYWQRYCTLWAAYDLYGYTDPYYQTWNAWNAVRAPW